MWKPIPKTEPSGASLGANGRVHIDHPTAGMVFQTSLNHYLTKLYNPIIPLIILCIGTDRSTGDCLGPLVGSKLENVNLQQCKIYGTLDQPVHAVNLQDTIDEIENVYNNPFILAIDACLGRTESIGFISIKEGSLQPGTGVNKTLPAVGNLQIIGVVNVGGFMEYMVLQNTRLNLVMKMADIISQGIVQTLKTIEPIDSSLIEAAPIHEPQYY